VAGFCEYGNKPSSEVRNINLICILAELSSNPVLRTGHSHRGLM
jgi:hypothetical protein